MRAVSQWLRGLDPQTDHSVDVIAELTADNHLAGMQQEAGR